MAIQWTMPPRVAIPVPHSSNSRYTDESLPEYEHAVRLAGGEPVRIPLDQPPAEVMKLIEHCDAVLLPGSPADVDPSKYSARPHLKTAPPDAKRDTIDELLLQDAYNMRKPILGICYGLQILNVQRSGTLLQDIVSPIDHACGKRALAHTIAVEPGSKLAQILQGDPLGSNLLIPVNSSHHQAAEIVGDGLRVVASSSEDGVIEALEGTSPEHFVLAVQWHPEKSVDDDEHSRAIFSALVEAAQIRRETLQTQLQRSS